MISSTAIREISDRIAAEYNPNKIILFGSHATGTASADSNIDLLVIMPFEGKSSQKSIEILNRVDPHFEVNLIAIGPYDATLKYDQHDPVIREALDKGVVLYEGQGEPITHIASSNDLDVGWWIVPYIVGFYTYNYLWDRLENATENMAWIARYGIHVGELFLLMEIIQLYSNWKSLRETVKTRSELAYECAKEAIRYAKIALPIALVFSVIISLGLKWGLISLGIIIAFFTILTRIQVYREARNPVEK